MYFLAVIFSGGFGISNILFDTIIGGAQSLNDVSRNLLGDCGSANVCGAGIGSVGNVKNIGLLLFMTLICLAASIVFIVLGLVFFLRTILIFILFAISPLAVVAGLTEEFKPWFGRWFQSVQAMLIAPIPVAVCFALIKAFTGAIPSANGDPAGFILQLVYIISFMAIGAILMFKIAGQVGGLAYGLAAAGIGAVAGLGVGVALWKAGSGSGSSEGDRSNGNESGDGSTSKGGISTGSPNKGATSSGSNATADSSSNASGVNLGSLPPAPSVAGVDQQQRQLLNALRSLNENMSASSMERTTTTTSIPPVTGGRSGIFSHRAASNVQNGLLWAGREAGVSAPYFTIGYDRRNENSGVGSTTNVIERNINSALNRTETFYNPDEHGPDSNSQGVSASPPVASSNEGSFIEPVNPAPASNPTLSKAAAYPNAQPQQPAIMGQRPLDPGNYTSSNPVSSVLTPPPTTSNPGTGPVSQQSQRPKITGAIPDPYGNSLDLGGTTGNPTEE
jgi:hypothetical protein